MPFLTSGNSFLIYGANLCNLASASITSSYDIGKSSRISLNSFLLSFIHKTSSDDFILEINIGFFLELKTLFIFDLL